MPKGQRRILECLLCRKKYSKQDVFKRRYFLRTLVCSECYEKGAKTLASVWCFGKLAGPHSPGFSKKNVACTTLCPDRKICSDYVSINLGDD